MAIVAATLDINFISNYVGQHRICYRIAPAISYDCTNSVICTGGGASCSISIPITVDNESCNSVTYEGYVQAACQDISSLVDRIPFSITFVPNPTCDSYRVTCTNVEVASVTRIIPGTGYDPLSPPIVTITLGGGIGATATATVGNDTEIINAGILPYADGVYVGIPIINLTTTGSGGIATATIAGGFLTSFIITTTGTGYFPNTTFTFNDSDLGGIGGTGIEIRYLSNYGTVTSTTLVLPGSGYTSVPTVTIDPPAIGVTATATATLASCPNQILGTTCNGAPSPSISGMSLGQSARVCMTDLPVILPEYTFVPEGCCYDCVNVCFNVSMLSPATDIYYTDCTTNLLTMVTVGSGSSSGLLNVVNNSWYWSPVSSIVTVSFGACP
jgi:hypothetical protein